MNPLFAIFILAILYLLMGLAAWIWGRGVDQALDDIQGRLVQLERPASLAPAPPAQNGQPTTPRGWQGEKPPRATVANFTPKDAA